MLERAGASSTWRRSLTSRINGALLEPARVDSSRNERMSTVATPTREHVESLVRSILVKHQDNGSATNGRAHRRRRARIWWSISRRGIVI